MKNSYEINKDDKVIPYTDGKMDKDTASWRSATELELRQRKRIHRLEKRIEILEEIKDWVISNVVYNEQVVDMIDKLNKIKGS